MSGREKLLQLEKEGKYLFHGSPVSNIESMEPRQATHVPELSKPTETILDGKPAVSATPYIEFAIFRAIINRENIPFSHNSGFGFKNGKKEFRISSKKILEEIKNKRGFVYVFNKNEFEPYSRGGEIHDSLMEWRSYKTVKPIDVIEVNYTDLVSEDLIDIRQ